LWIFDCRLPKLALAIWQSAIWFALVCYGSDAENSSLSEMDIEFTEAKLTLQTVVEENESLRQQLDLTRQQLSSLTETLALATTEAEVFRRESGELKLRMEALGLDSADPDRSKLEQRLLKAVRDLQIVQKERDQLADHLVRLSEAMVRYLQTATSDDAETRLALEEEMRAASEALGVPGSQTVEGAPVSPTLTDGMVISVKEELALVVANIGSRQGVKTGMPFQVWRGGNRIGLVRVVDVRERISGAVIQDLNSDKERVKVGDRLRVDAR
jgi:hypothetical protein